MHGASQNGSISAALCPLPFTTCTALRSVMTLMAVGDSKRVDLAENTAMRLIAGLTHFRWRPHTTSCPRRSGRLRTATGLRFSACSPGATFTAAPELFAHLTAFITNSIIEISVDASEAALRSGRISAGYMFRLLRLRRWEIVDTASTILWQWGNKRSFLRCTQDVPSSEALYYSNKEAFL